MNDASYKNRIRKARAVRALLGVVVGGHSYVGKIFPSGGGAVAPRYTSICLALCVPTYVGLDRGNGFGFSPWEATNGAS
jgi:hypothetical protein